MNVRMWEHPATQENVERLRRPRRRADRAGEGELAEGEIGPGRMTEPEEIFARCRALLGEVGPSRESRARQRGRTREPLDAVRYLGNRSSGRMGVAVAEEARRRGAEVTLLAANLAVPAAAGVELVETPSAARLADAARARGVGHRRHGRRSRRLPAAEAIERTSGRRTATRGRSSSSRRRTSGGAGRQRDERAAARRLRRRPGKRGSSVRARSSRAKAVDLIVFNDVSLQTDRLRRCGQRGRDRVR